MTQMKDGLAANAHDVKAWNNVHYRHTTPETQKSAWQQFQDHQDPYNTDNFLTGWVQMTGGDEYGNLVIETVNGRPAPQRVRATPKTAYPYARDRAWLLNTAEWIRSARKLDGTNICQYAYQDADGNSFTTFKLRVRPFLPAHFRVLLDRALKKYPKTAALQMQPGEAMIYELYGRQNPMLIIYKEDIELAALCRRAPEDGNMEPADSSDPNFARLDCPLSEVTPPATWSDIKEEYQKRQGQYSLMLQEDVQNGERAFHGHEGEMLYVRFQNGERTAPGAFTRLIKLKPVEIEEIHQASDSVPKAELEATARNIFEVADNPEVHHFVQMLSEEWSEAQIQKSMDTLQRVLEQTLEKRKFEDEILTVFNREFVAETFRTDKGAVMRRLSEIYPKSIINRVYGALDTRLP